MIKYLLQPGPIISKTDHDMHLIGYRQLITLYGLDPKECRIWDSGCREEGFIVLGPLYHGDYAEHLQRVTQND